MALAVPLALKKLLGLPVDVPTDGIAASVAPPSTEPLETPVPPTAAAKLFGPAVNPKDQAAAEAADPTDATAAIKVPQSVSMPALKKAAAPAPEEAPEPTLPNDPSDVAGLSSSKPTADQLPSLAPQGSSHAVPAALLRLMGITADQPKAGEQYEGPIGTDAKLKAGMGFVGRLGNALAAAAGTSEQKELAEKRSEFGPELQAKTDIAKAQIKSLGDYRQGELRNVADRNDINQQKADQANQIAVGKMALQGQVPKEGEPGVFRFMTPDEVLAHPLLSKNIDLKTAAINYKNKTTELQQAKIDALNDPNSQTLKNKVKDLQIRWAIAQQQFAQKQHSLANGDERNDMAEFTMLQNMGGNTRGQTLNPDNAAPATMVNGQPTPMKSSAFPTTTMRNIEAQANTAAEGIPGTIQEITRLKDKLGPVSGRWNEFMQGKVGADDPDFAGLRSDLLMEASAVALAHARGRLPENLRQEFNNMINAPQQTPENIVSILQHIQPWMERASHMSVPTAPAASSPKKATPAVAPAGAVPSFADWKKSQGGQ